MPAPIPPELHLRIANSLVFNLWLITYKVSIVLLNYNGVAFNEDCINSLLQQNYRDFEIIFVNNKSDDGSCEQVEKIFDKQIQQGILKIIQPGYNSGFAQGNNIGVANSDPQSEYICLLNNDVIAPADRLQNLVSGMESDPKLGAVGSIIYDKGYEKEMDEFLFKKHLKGVNNYFFDSVTIEQTKEDREGNIVYTTGLSGCCLMYKKKLLEEPFDDMYFAYMEDTALCIKIILQGYRVGMVKDSHIQHFGSASFGKKPNVFKTFHGIKNFILNFILLSYGYWRIIVLPWFTIGLITRSIFNHPLIRLQGLGKALWRILSHILTIIKVKIEIKKTIKPAAFYRQLSPQFITVPYYTKSPNRYKYIVKALNVISSRYFGLFGP